MPEDGPQRSLHGRRRCPRALLAAAATLIPIGSVFAQAGGKEASFQGRTVSQWIASLASRDSTEAGKARLALQSIGIPAVPALTSAAAGHADPTTRAVCVDILGEIGSKGVASTLLKSIKTDRALDVRIPAAHWLGKLAEKGDAEASNAVSLLVPTLIEATGSNDYDTASDASAILESLGPPAKPSLTNAALTSGNWKVRQRAVASLGLIGGPGVLPTLLKALGDAAEQVRFMAAMVMPTVVKDSSADAATAVPALIRTLKDKDAGVRWRAAEALGKIGAPAKSAIPALNTALKDPDKDVRDAAAEALGRLTFKTAP